MLIPNGRLILIISQAGTFLPACRPLASSPLSVLVRGERVTIFVAE